MRLPADSCPTFPHSTTRSCASSTSHHRRRGRRLQKPKSKERTIESRPLPFLPPHHRRMRRMRRWRRRALPLPHLLSHRHRQSRRRLRGRGLVIATTTTTIRIRTRTRGISDLPQQSPSHRRQSPRGHLTRALCLPRARPHHPRRHRPRHHPRRHSQRRQRVPGCRTSTRRPSSSPTPLLSRGH